MAGSKCVVAIDIAHRGQDSSVLGITLLFALVESDVLQHQDFAILQSRRLGLGIVTDGIGCEVDRAAQQFLQTDSNWLQAVLGVFGRVFPFGAAEVTHQDDSPAAIENGLDRREGFGDTSVVGNLLPIIQRDIEIAAHQHCQPRNIDIGNRLLGHGRVYFRLFCRISFMRETECYPRHIRGISPFEVTNVNGMQR